MPEDNINQPSAYALLIFLAEQRIGTLALDKSTNLLKLEYESSWQETGYPLSPALTLDNEQCFLGAVIQQRLLSTPLTCLLDYAACDFLARLVSLTNSMRTSSCLAHTFSKGT
ncbi:HipA N-terminal domain-containing protein [Alteromonas sp. A081]|uniref:HipA N-terminal domain-containing protein n=1 Tax=Alteromonas sp. A081 TaxID=3410269 RepID=UPI003B982B9B